MDELTGQPTITLCAGIADTTSPPETVEIVCQIVAQAPGTYRLRVQTFSQDLGTNRVYQTTDDSTVEVGIGVLDPDAEVADNCTPIYFENLPIE